MVPVDYMIHLQIVINLPTLYHTMVDVLLFIVVIIVVHSDYQWLRMVFGDIHNVEGWLIVKNASQKLLQKGYLSYDKNDK